MYSVPHSQVKLTCFVAKYCTGNFLSAKKCRKYTFRYILEVVKDEINSFGFGHTVAASEGQTTAQKNSNN
jgi:hypothetical protein